MEYIQLTEENIEKEHILCISIVSGSCKGHGYANDLLKRCIDDAKQKGKAA